MTIDTARSVLENAISFVQSHGWTIAPGGVGFAEYDRKRCCPLGAICIINGVLSSTFAWDWCKWHDIQPRWFVEGFDGRAMSGPVDESSRDVESFELGREFRRRYVEEVQS